MGGAATATTTGRRQCMDVHPTSTADLLWPCPPAETFPRFSKHFLGQNAAGAVLDDDDAGHLPPSRCRLNKLTRKVKDIALGHMHAAGSSQQHSKEAHAVAAAATAEAARSAAADAALAEAPATRRWLIF